jgi:hypothetical protein
MVIITMAMLNNQMVNPINHLINILLGGFKHWDYFPFNIWDKHPNWLSYFSEG